MMRCFLPCFGTSKRPNQLRSADATPSEGAQTHVEIKTLARQKTVVEEFIDSIAESRIKNEEQSKKEEAPQIEDDDEIHKTSHQEESSESLFSLSICSRKKVSDVETTDAEINSPMQLVCKREVPEAIRFRVSTVLSPLEILSQGNSSEDNEGESSAEELLKKLDENEGEKGKVKANDPVPQHRYRDCPDDGYDDVILDATLEDGDPQSHSEKREEVADVNRTSWVQDESSESLFSLSTDSRIRISSAEEAENEVNSVMPLTGHAAITITNRIMTEDVSSVLNPIENLTQGRRGVKATVMQPPKKDKENINLVVQDVDIPISPEPSLKLSNRKARQRFNDKKQEIGVDTSLSSWLAESETTPSPKGRRGSPWSHEDRPILGALTVEEIRTYSISISPRRSRSRSPDETPIIGSVGSYWSHTDQSMDSEFNKSGKDVKLKRSSTALQTRLEQAFEASVSEV